MELTRNELLEVNGGVNITGTLLNSIISGINAFLDLGRSVGTAIRRIGSNNVCKL